MRLHSIKMAVSRILKWHNSGAENKDILVDIGRSHPIHLRLNKEIPPFKAVKLHTTGMAGGESFYISCDTLTKNGVASYLVSLRQFFDDGMLTYTDAP